MIRQVRSNRAVTRNRWTNETTMLLLCGIFVAAIPFDAVVQINVPLLRNPAALVGTMLLAYFIWTTRAKLVVSNVAQLLAIAFIVTIGLQELIRIVFADVQFGAYTGTPSALVVLWLYLARIQPIVLFLLLTVIALDTRSVAYVLSGFPLVMSFLGAGALVAAGVGRWAPVGLNENYAGGAFGVALVIALGLVVQRQASFPRSLWFALVASIPVCVIGLLVSGSRGASAATAAAVFVFLLMSRIDVRRVIIVSICFAAAAFVLGPFLQSASEVLIARWDQTIEGTSYGGRDSLAMISVRLASERPLWGYGLQSNYAVGEAWLNEPGAPFSSHNTVFGLLLSFGIFGSLPWFGFVFLVGLQAFRHRRNPNGPLLLALLAFFAAHAVTSDLATNKLFYVVLGLAACVPSWSKGADDSSTQEARQASCQP